jgi:L,D-transpeptidase YbiS
MKMTKDSRHSGCIPAIEISIQDQCLRLQLADEVKEYSISTAKLGLGQSKGSNKTPLGWHTIRAKIGADASLNSVFVGRRFTGEIYSPELAQQFPQRDWILSRILWLSGCEVGCNRLGDVDSMQRYIYIHGTPDSEPMGVPESHGCIRMRNTDVIELFDLTPAGTLIWLQESTFARIPCRSV